MDDAFAYAELGRTGLRAFRLGLAATYRPGKDTIHRALGAGVNFFFSFGFDGQMISVLRDVLKKDRERYIVATGAYSYIWAHQNLRRTLEKRLRQLDTDYIDLFLFLGVARRKYLTGPIRDELHRLRADDRVRAVGLSTHDRELAGELAREGSLDALMIRYNAAHRGAEQDIFPHVARYDPAIVSFTATRWRRLLRRPRRWPGNEPTPTAGMCYRFVLSSPHVDVCLTAPTNRAQLEENLAAVRAGALDPDELEQMHRFGDAVRQRCRWFI